MPLPRNFRQILKNQKSLTEGLLTECSEADFDALGLSLEHLTQAGCDTPEKQRAMYKAAQDVQSGAITTLEELEDVLGHGVYDERMLADTFRADEYGDLDRMNESVKPLTEAKKQKLSIRDARSIDGLAHAVWDSIIDKLGDLDLQINQVASDKLENAVEAQLRSMTGMFDDSGELTPEGNKEYDRVYDKLDGVDNGYREADKLVYGRLMRALLRKFELEAEDLMKG